MNKFDIWKKLMHKNAINMLEGVKKILLWRIFERNLAKFFCGAFLSTFWPNCGAFRRKIISHTDSKVPKSQAFDLFEFLIYSIPVFHTIFDKEKDLSSVHSSCCLGDRFAFELSVRCMSVFRWPSRFKSIRKPFHVESSIVFNL